MKRKLTVLETTIMAAAAITACSGKNTKAITTTEVVTQTGTTARMMDEEMEDTGATSDSETATESQSSESVSQGAVLLEEAEDISHAGAGPGQSKIKSFTGKVQKAVADKDTEALAGLCTYSVYVSLGEGRDEEIADESAFLKMDAGQIFTESLLKEIADMDVDMLEQFDAGVIMGEENSIILNNVDRQAAIIGINPNQSIFEHVMSGHAMKKNEVSR